MHRTLVSGFSFESLVKSSCLLPSGFSSSQISTLSRSFRAFATMLAVSRERFSGLDDDVVGLYLHPRERAGDVLELLLPFGRQRALGVPRLSRQPLPGLSVSEHEQVHHLARRSICPGRQEGSPRREHRFSSRLASRYKSSGRCGRDFLRTLQPDTKTNKTTGHSSSDRVTGYSGSS